VSHRIKRARLLRTSDGEELTGFVYDESEDEYEVLVAQDELLILFFNKISHVERGGGYLLHLPKEDL
jgi:hypothetical protein